jgi:hypothetical protein
MAYMETTLTAPLLNYTVFNSRQHNFWTQAKQAICNINTWVFQGWIFIMQSSGLQDKIIQWVGANVCNIYHHKYLPTFTTCSSLVCLDQLMVQHSTGVTWFILRHWTRLFMDWLNGTVNIPGMKTDPWLEDFPNILSEIFALNSTITVRHPLL